MAIFILPLFLSPFSIKWRDNRLPIATGDPRKQVNKKRRKTRKTRKRKKNEERR